MYCPDADAKCFRRFEDTRAGRQFRPDSLDDIGAHRTTRESLPYHRGDSRNGTKRFPNLRTQGIVPSDRRLRFDGPVFRLGDRRFSLTREIIF